MHLKVVDKPANRTPSMFDVVDSVNDPFFAAHDLLIMYSMRD